MKKSLVERFRFWARNSRSKELFRVLTRCCHGRVLDVGGRDFFQTISRKKISFQSWITLEQSPAAGDDIKDPRFHFIRGDGCALPFADRSFDTVLNIQVLEHVLHPIMMIRETARVLKPSALAVFLIPQTAVLHELPAHYYNFTRFWIERVMEEAGLSIVEYKAVGGLWSSMASHQVHFFFQWFRVKGMSGPQFRRNIWFYLLLPLMVLYALVSIPVCLFLSLGDLTEEPNNHLVVVRKV